jgi:hypothetical protein
MNSELDARPGFLTILQKLQLLLLNVVVVVPPLQHAGRQQPREHHPHRRPLQRQERVAVPQHLVHEKRGRGKGINGGDAVSISNIRVAALKKYKGADARHAHPITW